MNLLSYMDLFIIWLTNDVFIKIIHQYLNYGYYGYLFNLDHRSILHLIYNRLWKIIDMYFDLLLFIR
jgi:hypothetical protein